MLPDVKHRGRRTAGGRAQGLDKPVDGRTLVGANLRRLRARRGWSQEALADHAGIHRTYVGSVERAERNISINNICRLAWALGVEVRELFAPVAGER